MQIELGTLLAAGLPLLGLAATWGALGFRLRAVEKQAATIDDLRKFVDGVDSKIEAVRKDQGGRLGKLGEKVDDLRGQFEGFRYGFAVAEQRARQKTAALGQPIAESDARKDDGEP